jgi:Ni,Fe-hydrogenase III large subunit/Ni,Fe-hydrogenase III component G
MIEGTSYATTEIPGAVPARHAGVTTPQWSAIAQQVCAQGGRLLALWGSDWRARRGRFAVHAAYGTRDGLLWVTLEDVPDAPGFPDLAGVFPSAGRMQRALFDLLGVCADGAQDTRPWLRHAAWPGDAHPLRRDFDSHSGSAGAADDYAFVRVAGDGVHEIPVGPVHAGTIEPGHFRFSVLGERVLRLEQRLGYKHKGIEKRFEQLSLEQGAALAGRISGDCTVGYAWAYSMAVESATRTQIPERARWLRALLLERERVANHLGDLGLLGNDAGLAFGFAQLSKLKEDWLRGSAQAFGHRYLMDVVVPGGVSADLAPQCRSRMQRDALALQADIVALRAIYDDHPGMQDRFINCGKVAPELAARLGLTGLAGRASAQSWDLRCQFGPAPYDALDVRMVTHRNGDVAARVTVRFEEALESLRLILAILDRIPEGETRAPLPPTGTEALGVGWIEGWRGEIVVALETGGDGAIARCHAHDPSWHNWPVLEHAVIGNIVPDFPLINKSFNLTYSGHDL